MRAANELAAVLLVGTAVALSACGGEKPAAKQVTARDADPIAEVETPLPPAELETSCRRRCARPC